MAIFDIFFAPPNCLSRNVRFCQTWIFLKACLQLHETQLKLKRFIAFFVFSQGSKNGQKFQKNIFFQKLNFHISFESSWRADSKNANFFEKILLLDVLQPIEGSKSSIFDIFFAPLNVISRNGQIWTNLDFSESLFVASWNAIKTEAIYSFFVFSQGSKNGQKFQKN